MLSPAFTVEAPGGAIEPLAPAVAVMMYVSIAKMASIVWFAWTGGNVNGLTAPCDTPSILTSTRWWSALAVIVYVGVSPSFTVVVPGGEIDPSPVAVAMMVYVLIAKVASIVWSALTLLKV